MSFGSKIDDAFKELGEAMPSIIDCVPDNVFMKAFERADKAVEGFTKANIVGFRVRWELQWDSYFEFASILIKDIFAATKGEHLFDKNSIYSHLDLDCDEYYFIRDVVSNFKEQYDDIAGNYLQISMLRGIDKDFLFGVVEKLYELNKLEYLYSDKDALAADIEIFLVEPMLYDKKSSLTSDEFRFLCQYALKNEPELLKTICEENFEMCKNPTYSSADALYDDIKSRGKEPNQIKEIERK